MWYLCEKWSNCWHNTPLRWRQSVLIGWLAKRSHVRVGASTSFWINSRNSTRLKPWINIVGDVQPPQPSLVCDCWLFYNLTWLQVFWVFVVELKTWNSEVKSVKIYQLRLILRTINQVVLRGVWQQANRMIGMEWRHNSEACDWLGQQNEVGRLSGPTWCEISFFFRGWCDKKVHKHARNRDNERNSSIAGHYEQNEPGHADRGSKICGTSGEWARDQHTW